MIIQRLLDSIAYLISQFIRSVPPLPTELGQAVGDIETGAAYLGGVLAKVGILVPWEAIGLCFNIWLGGLGYWSLMLAVRLVLWAFGR